MAVDRRKKKKKKLNLMVDMTGRRKESRPGLARSKSFALQRFLQTSANNQPTAPIPFRSYNSLQFQPTAKSTNSISEWITPSVPELAQGGINFLHVLDQRNMIRTLKKTTCHLYSDTSSSEERLSSICSSLEAVKAFIGVVREVSTDGSRIVG